jgi:molecular chaperone DnaJ
VLRLTGRGLPRFRGGGQGDLHLELVLEVPTGLSESERARLAAWAGSLPADRHPQRAAFAAATEARR